MSNQKYRDQVADLILLDADGQELVVTSNLSKNEDGSILFEVGEAKPDGIRYRVTLKIEEV